MTTNSNQQQNASLRTPTTLTNNHQKERNNIWGSLLKQQKIDPKIQEGIEDSYSVVFLGDAKNGQRSLARRFQGKEISGDVYHDTLSIEYTFFKAIDPTKHDDFSDSTRNDREKFLNIYQMENQYFSYLLDFAINPSTFEKTVVVITMDISNTKNIISRTKKWIRILQDHINEKIIPELTEEGMHKCYERVKSIYKKGEQSVSENPNGFTVIDTNLGIPIIIALTKSDLAEKIADSFCSKKSLVNIIPHHFLNFISFKLRKLCYRYGASLFYTSSSCNINCLLLKKYILNICYNTPFHFAEIVETRDHSSIVIPSGCDTVQKIKSIECSTVTNDPEGIDFETFVSDFDLASSDTSLEVVEFEDFEFFLKKQQKVRNMMQRPTDIDLTLLSPPSIASPLRAFNNRSTSKGNHTPRGHSPRSNGLTLATPELFRNDSSENVILKASTPDQVENAEHFFHQLLQRYSTKTPQQTPNKQ